MLFYSSSIGTNVPPPLFRTIMLLCSRSYLPEAVGKALILKVENEMGSAKEESRDKERGEGKQRTKKGKSRLVHLLRPLTPPSPQSLSLFSSLSSLVSLLTSARARTPRARPARSQTPLQSLQHRRRTTRSSRTHWGYRRRARSRRRPRSAGRRRDSSGEGW